MNNYGTIIGGLVDDNGVIRRVAVDIRGATSDHVDALKIGNKVDGVNVGGEVIGDIYMNNEAGQTNIDGNNKNSYVAFYGSAVDKAIFDGKLIANTAEVNIQSDGYMLLRAQDESIVFDVVDYGADLENQNNGKFD